MMSMMNQCLRLLASSLRSMLMTAFFQETTCWTPQSAARLAALCRPASILNGTWRGALTYGTHMQAEDPASQSATQNGAPSSVDPLMNLLDLEEVLSAPSSGPATSAAPALQLHPSPVLEPAAYQVPLFLAHCALYIFSRGGMIC